MEFPTHQLDLPISVLGLLGGVFFIQILKEHSVSKNWRPWSDAVWSGSALFAYDSRKGRSSYMGL